MANLNRYAGNLLPFASNSTGTNRTVFGGITQSDDIDDNITSDFLLGWEIVSAAAAPTKQDFNALGYTTSLLVAYLYQKGIPEWEAAQEYHIDTRQIGDKSVGSDGFVYSSLVDTNVGNDPVGDLTNWLSDFSLYSIREVTHNITVDADYTLTAAQNFYKRIVITDTNPFLTTARNIVVNNIEREFIVENSTLQTLTVKTALGTGISIPSGETFKLRCDGTNVISSDTLTNEQNNQVAKAWVNFNGIGVVAINASYNVSSITDNGAGQYTVNFTTPMIDANYALTLGGKKDPAAGSIDTFINEDKDFTRTASAVRLNSGDPSTQTDLDFEIISVSVFR